MSDFNRFRKHPFRCVSVLKGEGLVSMNINMILLCDKTIRAIVLGSNVI